MGAAICDGHDLAEAVCRAMSFWPHEWRRGFRIACVSAAATAPISPPPPAASASLPLVHLRPRACCCWSHGDRVDRARSCAPSPSRGCAPRLVVPDGRVHVYWPRAVTPTTRSLSVDDTPCGACGQIRSARGCVPYAAATAPSLRELPAGAAPPLLDERPPACAVCLPRRDVGRADPARIAAPPRRCAGTPWPAGGRPRPSRPCTVTSSSAHATSWIP